MEWVGVELDSNLVLEIMMETGRLMSLFTNPTLAPGISSPLRVLFLMGWVGVELVFCR
jgi:hypothetical protein